MGGYRQSISGFPPNSPLRPAMPTTPDTAMNASGDRGEPPPPVSGGLKRLGNTSQKPRPAKTLARMRQRFPKVRTRLPPNTGT